MSAAMGSKIETLERNWRRVASTHTLQDLMNADKPPAETGISIKAFLSGILLIVAGASCIALGVLTFGAPWLLPKSNNAFIEAIRNDNYYHLLVPAMVPVTIITIFINWFSNMENHNFDQTPVKRLADYFGDDTDFNFMVEGIAGGFPPQFFNSPYFPDLPEDLENVWLASPWQRGTGGAPTQNTPQDLLNNQLAMQSTGGLFSPAPQPQGGLVNNFDGFPRPKKVTPKKPPPFPKFDARSYSTVGTQTSPGLECNANAHLFAQNIPFAKTTKSVATAPVAGNTNAQKAKKRNSTPLQGGSLPPLPKRPKLASDQKVATSKPSSQVFAALDGAQQPRNTNNNINNTLTAAIVQEIINTSYPFNAPLPSRGTKALNLAKMGPASGDLDAKTKSKPKIQSKGPPQKTNLAPPSAAPASAGPYLHDTNMSDNTAPSVAPSGRRSSTLFTAPTAAATTAADAAISGTVSGITNSAYDFLMCEVCGLGEPEESIILCDGCDLGYHLECLCPALTQVPEGTWFCSSCSQLAAGLNQSPRHHDGRHHPQQQRQQQKQLPQHNAAGDTFNPGSGAVAPPVPPLLGATHTNIISQAAPATAYGPLGKQASHLISLFSSDRPLRYFKTRHAQLQILIFLAEHGAASTPDLQLQYRNNDVNITSGVKSLTSAGVIFPQGKLQSRGCGIVWALDPVVPRTVDLWKAKLATLEQELAAQKAAEQGQKGGENDSDEDKDSDEYGYETGSEDDEEEEEEGADDDNDYGPQRTSQPGIKYNFFSLLRSVEPLPLSDTRRSQLQALVFLKGFEALTAPEIRERWEGVLYKKGTLDTLVKAGLFLRTNVQEVGKKVCFKYSLAPAVLPYIEEFKAKLQQHEMAQKHARALEVEEKNTTAGDVSMQEPIQEGEELADEERSAPSSLAASALLPPSSQYHAAGGTLGRGGVAPPRTNISQLATATATAYGPLSQQASHLISLFNSPDRFLQYSNINHAKLQILIFLAEHGQASTTEMRVHYKNLYMKNGVRSLSQAGLIIPVQDEQPLRNQTIYALDPTLVHNVAVWKDTLAIMDQAYEAQQRGGKVDLEDGDTNSDTDSEEEGDGEEDDGVQFTADGAVESDFTHSNVFSLLCSPEPFPLSAYRQSQLKVLVLLNEHGKLSVVQIRKHWDKYESRHGTLNSLFKNGFVIRTRVQEPAERARFEYSLVPGAVPYIEIFKEKLQQHEMAQKYPRTQTAKEKKKIDGDVSVQEPINEEKEDANEDGLVSPPFGPPALLPPPPSSSYEKNGGEKQLIQFQQEQQQQQVRQQLFASLCSDADIDGNFQVLPTVSTWRQLQVLIYLAEHGEAFVKCLQDHYNYKSFYNVLPGLMDAGLILRILGEKNSSSKSPYKYKLAPGVQIYLPIWKKNLQYVQDSLQDNPLYGYQKKNENLKASVANQSTE